ncbi:MAG: 3-keto-5-aminohexanoate cleavage protein [Proteobacteria bacterium]|nr:3-keto-5-aminohexanoate cleavage protein [Pseudomonadota bacterium]
MAEPTIITVAITGSVPRKKDNPAVPVEPEEQIESTQRAFEAGAALAHIHVRDKDENPSSDPGRFLRVKEGVMKHCPGMIIQFSTGGRGRAGAERWQPLLHDPDMASLTTGSVNFPASIYENTPQLIEEMAKVMLERDIKPEIEVFDLAMLYNAHNMAEKGLLRRPIHCQFVMGIPNALPAREKTLDFLISELRELEPDATWAAMGISRWQIVVNEWCLKRGGHLRTGLEDNIYRAKGVLATGNADLVRLAADLCAKYGRRPATPAEARMILKLRPAT